MGNRRRVKFDDRDDAQQLAQPVEAFEKLRRPAINPKPYDAEEEMYAFIDTFREQRIMDIHGYTEAFIECGKVRAMIALKVFEHEFEQYSDFDEAMSDGVYSDEHFELLGKVEDRIMKYAHEIRQRRLDATNKRFKGE